MPFNPLIQIKTIFVQSLSNFVMNHVLRYYITPEHMKAILTPPNHLRPLLRTTYHGGRTTVYDINIYQYTVKYNNNIITPTIELDDYLYYLDINSSYPSIMLWDLPNGHVAYEKTKKQVWELNNNGVPFIDLNLYTVI